MEVKEKDLLRKWFAIISFAYVLVFCTVAFGFHLGKYDVISFWPIFSGVIGYLTTLGAVHYFTSPKSANAV